MGSVDYKVRGAALNAVRGSSAALEYAAAENVWRGHFTMQKSLEVLRMLRLGCCVAGESAFRRPCRQSRHEVGGIYRLHPLPVGPWSPGTFDPAKVERVIGAAVKRPRGTAHCHRSWLRVQYPAERLPIGPILTVPAAIPALTIVPTHEDVEPIAIGCR